MQEILNENIGACFQEQVKKHPEKSAVIYLGSHFTYKQLLKWSRSFSNTLWEQGVRPGDRVMIYLPNGPQWMVSWLGILMLGATAVPITPIYTVSDVRYMANDSESKVIVCTDTNIGYVKEAFPETKLQKIIYTNIADLLPQWKYTLGRLLDVVPKGNIEKQSNTIPFKKAINGPAGKNLNQNIGGDALAEILYTGGTTKHPKGVPITHNLFLSSVMPTISMSEPVIPRGENIILQGAPLFHILGQIMGMGSICLCGDTVIPLPRMNVDGMMNTIQHDKVKSLFGVPAMFRMILDHDRLDFYDLSSLKYCLSGGDVLPEEILRRWKDKFGLPIGRGYGATETVGGIAVTPIDHECPEQSYGPILYHKKSLIVDHESLEEVKPGTPGELLLSSDPMVTAYWNKPEETEKAFIQIDGKLWYRTSDIVSRDENDNIYFIDRTVDVIKHKGYRISASEIESVLQDHPAVVDTCVVGVPDPKVGERIKAFVILKEDIKGMSGTDLIRFCRGKLVNYKIPQYIEFRDMLPKSKVGKLLRKDVRSDEDRRRKKGKWDKATTE